MNRRLNDEFDSLKICLVRIGLSNAMLLPAYDEHIEKMANDAVNVGSTTNNPVIPTLDQIKNIYHKIYYD